MFCVTTLCQVKPIGQTCSLLLVAIINLELYIYYQRLKLRGAIHQRDKSVPGRSISRKIYCLHIWTRFFYLFQRKNIMLSCFSDGSNMLIHIRLSRYEKNATCFNYSLWWSRSFLNNCMLILSWTHIPLNQDFLSTLGRDYCCPYKVNFWCYEIA